MQEYRKTLLIVCEGARSEPDYFDCLRNEVIEKCGKEIFIKILPIPSSEAIQNDFENFQLRKGAKKRFIKNNKEVEDFVVEDEFKSQPTCYIRKAQLAHIESNYDELWAVYDKDGHASHKEAYELSINVSRGVNQKVNIGFNAIAFEMWVLLHFEYSTINFKKSLCRDSAKNYFYCGSNTHKDDCHGKLCVVGKIVTSKYIPCANTKKFNYDDYGFNFQAAFKNAILMRENSNPRDPFYDLNPYTTIDKLVFKLKYFSVIDHIWIDASTFEVSKDIKVKLSRESDVILVSVSNQSDVAYILNDLEVYSINVDYSILEHNKRCVLDPNERIVLKFDISIDGFCYLILKIGIDKGYIFDRSYLRTQI